MQFNNINILLQHLFSILVSQPTHPPPPFEVSWLKFSYSFFLGDADESSTRILAVQSKMIEVPEDNIWLHNFLSIWDRTLISSWPTMEGLVFIKGLISHKKTERCERR